MNKATLLISLILLGGCQSIQGGSGGPKVRVTLSDGQILLGQLSTETFALKTDMGPLDFDSEDAGELGLVKGKNVAQSGNMIRLWLRNGSEFVGHWQKPALDLKLGVGGENFAITVPIAKLERLQFEGAAVWPENAVFRIQTKGGDDFFVDVTKNRLSFQTEFGEIRPFLSEIRSMQPLDKKNEKWRIYLSNGSLLEARFEQKVLSLTLAMGPEKILLPLKSIKNMNRQQLVFKARQNSLMQSSSQDSAYEAKAPQRRSNRGFYSNQAQKSAKVEAAKSWKGLQKQDFP
jgi:hypothetical protein